MDEIFHHGRPCLRVGTLGASIGNILAMKFDDTSTYFALYDGQKGNNVVKFCGKYLHDEIKSTETSLESQARGEEEHAFSKLCTAIERSFLSIDVLLKEPNSWKALNEETTTYDSTDDIASVDEAGSTACVAIIRKNHLIVGNAGLSRCVISRMGQAFSMSTDHRPKLPLEMKRIDAAKKALAAAGPDSVSDRTLEEVELPTYSRAIGYMMFKKINEVVPEEQIISAKAAVKIVQLRNDVQFMILASDGFWEKMKNQAAVDMVRQGIAEGESLCNICTTLHRCYLALAAGQDANIMIMIVQLEGALPYTPPEDKNEGKAVELKYRNFPKVVTDPVEWDKFRKKYILARDKDKEELCELLRVATLQSIEDGDEHGPRFTLPSRGDRKEVYVYEPKLQQVCLRRKHTYTARSVEKCRIMAAIIATSEALLALGQINSVTGVAYRIEHVTTDHEKARAALAEVCLLAECTRISMKICGTPHGSIAGPIQILANGVTFDCEDVGINGMTIPLEAEEGTGITKVRIKRRTPVPYIPVIEKKAVFQILTRLGFHKEKNCILLTGAGQADILTRIVLCRLAHELNVPVYCLVDANPWGSQIYCTFKYGSQTMAFDNLGLTTPQMKFIGLFSQDLTRVKRSSLKLLSRADEISLKGLLDKAWVQNDLPLYGHLVHMKTNGYKAQLESLQDTDGYDGLVSYINEKIALVHA